MLHRIQVFDREGRYVRGLGEEGRGEGQFRGPRGLCFTADGDLVVADSWNNRVQVFTHDGTFIRLFFGAPGATLERPFGVCVMPDGNITVVDDSICPFKMFEGGGRFVRSCGSREIREPGHVEDVVGVAVGGGGEIIVGDFDRNDVLVFSKEGELLQIIGAGKDSDVAFEKVRGAATDAEGRLFVIDSPDTIKTLS